MINFLNCKKTDIYKIKQVEDFSKMVNEFHNRLPLFYKNRDKYDHCSSCWIM